MMRVLHVNMSLAPATGGGTAERTVQLVRALRAAGAEPSVLTLDLERPAQQVPTLPDAAVRALPCWSERYYLPDPAAARREVAAAVREADIVHLMGHWTVLNALAYREARRQGRPHVVCPAGGLAIFGRSRLLKQGYNAAVGRRLIQTAAAHIAITAAERSAFAAYGVAPTDVQVIPNGVDLERVEPPRPEELRAARQHLDVGERRFVLFVGRLNPIKGPDLLVEAFATARDVPGSYDLVLAGPDEGMGAELDRAAARHGIAARVHRAGPVHGRRKSAAFAAASLLVVPSRREAMSIVALEAGAVGTPVLLTEACGFDEVEALGGGVVVPVDAAALAAGLHRLLVAAPDAQLLGMGARLRAAVRARYTWRAAAEAYLRVYDRVLGPPAHAAGAADEGFAAANISEAPGRSAHRQ